MAERVVLKHSGVKDLRPSPEYLIPGEIALNLNGETPGLYFKDSEGAIRKIGPVQVSNNPPAGDSIGELWVNPLAANSMSVWTGEQWEPAGAVSHVADVPPQEPENGQLWFDSVEKELKAYYEPDGTWVGYKENSTGVSISNAIAMGTGSSPYEIYVDSVNGTDSFTNKGTDERRPFRTLNRALIEAAKLSITRGVGNDEYDRVLIRCKNGNNVAYNSRGVGLDSIGKARLWGPINSEGTLALSYNRFIDGANLLLGNVDWITSRAFNALAVAFEIDYPESFDIKERASTIKSLISGLIQAIALDLKSNGNANTLRYAKSFYNGDGVLIAFDSLAIKDLFINVAMPQVVEKCLLAIQNRAAAQDDCLSLDTAAAKSEELCSNVQQAVLMYLEIFTKTLTGSLSLDVVSTKGNFPTEPTAAQLAAFNDPALGGLIIPRGVSVQGADLRKTVVTPDYVPSIGEEEGHAIFRFTGGSFFFNFTFKDNPTVGRSHHRLRCFSYATEAQLALFYQKVAKAFDLDTVDAEVRSPETNIVFEDGGQVDTTFGSSPYVFNCSIRSDYGLSGMEADGSLVGGLKSVVTAQFTNVSLQRDPAAWEVYDGAELEWRGANSYQEVLDLPVESVRYKQSYRHFAFKAKNGSYIQIVSCFVIGNAVHYWAQSGGDISITNSTSNFGGTSCISEGFLGQGTLGGALEQDSDFAVERLVRPLRLPISAEELPVANARRILVGVFDTFTVGVGYVDLYLQDNFLASGISPFELKAGSRIYFTDTSGDERAAIVEGFPLANINDSNDLGGVIRLNAATVTTGWEGNSGREIYIKRFFDFRGATDRAYKVRVRTTKTGTRRPQINFVFRLISGGTVGQTQVIRSGAQLDNITSGSRDSVFYIANVEDVISSGTETDFDTFDLTLLSLDSFTEFNIEYPYAQGDTTLYQGRLYRSLVGLNQGNDPSSSDKEWEAVRFQQEDESGVPVDAEYATVRQILDKDNGTVTMGLVRGDYDSMTQNHTLRAMNRFLEIMGYNEPTRALVLQPQSDGNRLFDPVNLPSPSNGAALLSNNWTVEFNRPSLIRASGHTWEWTGYFNYSKAIPNRQNSILSRGNRETSLTVERFGGRTYANGLTEEGEVFQNGKIIPRVSGLESSPDFDPVNTGGIVNKLQSLQIGECESPEPAQSWLSTDNLKVCSDILFTNSSVIRNRFALPSGVRASYGTGVVGTADGIQYGFSRPASLAEVQAGTTTNHYLTPALLRESARFEVGKISFFAANTFTSELYRYYLVCDGSLVNKASFPALYNFLRGVTYNAAVTSNPGATALYGETASQFRLPNLRGQFIRGWSGAGEPRGSGPVDNGLDTGRGFGATQGESFASHSHGVSDPGHSHGYREPGLISNGERDNNQQFGDTFTAAATSAAATGITVQATGGTETRPANIALLPCIRYI